MSFLVANGGTDTAAFTTLLNIQNALQLQGSYLFQVLINRMSRTTGLDGCVAVDRAQDVQVSTIITPFTQNPFTQNPFTQNPFTQNPFTQNPFTQNPFTQNPFTQNPFTQNPFTQNTDPRDPVISNSTFYIAPPATPGQSARAATPRPTAPPTVRQVVRREANGQFKTVLVQSPGPTTSNYRADRPVDLVVYTLRAFQIKPTNQIVVPLIPPGGQPPVGIVIAATTPNVVPLAGGGTGFDPDGPPVSGGGSAVPVKLAFVTQPTSTTPGAVFIPDVRVAIQDGFGNTLTTSTLPVTLAIGSNPSGGTLAGTLTRAAVNGIATFPTLSINNAGTGYTLVASSAGLMSATSAAFDISSVAPACYSGAIHSPVESVGIFSEPLMVRAAQGLGGDPNKDLVVLHGNGLTSLMQGDGLGHFAIGFQSLVPGTAGTPRDLKVADVDLDGHPDFVVAYSGSNCPGHPGQACLGFVRTTGSFSWADSTVLPLPLNPGAVAIGQINPNVDPYPDLVVPLRNPSGQASLAVLFRDGSGVWTLSPQPLGGFDPVAVAIGRMNGDNTPDVVVLNRGSQEVRVLLGDGNGGFGPPSFFPLGAPGLRTPSDSAEALALSDFNEDGILDVAVATDASDAQEGRAVITMLGLGERPARLPEQRSPRSLGQPARLDGRRLQ